MTPKAARRELSVGPLSGSKAISCGRVGKEELGPATSLARSLTSSSAAAAAAGVLHFCYGMDGMSVVGIIRVSVDIVTYLEEVGHDQQQSELDLSAATLADPPHAERDDAVGDRA